MMHNAALVYYLMDGTIKMGVDTGWQQAPLQIFSASPLLYMSHLSQYCCTGT